MAQDLGYFLHKFLHYGSGLEFFLQLFFSMAQDLEFFSHKNFLAMAQDFEFFSQTTILHYGSGLRFFFQVFKFCTLAYGLSFIILFSFQVYVNNVECKKHQYPIQKALRAVKNHAPSKYNEPPKHVNNLKCAPLNKIDFQSA